MEFDKIKTNELIEIFRQFQNFINFLEKEEKTINKEQ